MRFPIEKFCREQASDAYSGAPLFKCKRGELSARTEPLLKVSAPAGSVLPDHRTVAVGVERFLLDDLLPLDTYFGEPCARDWRAWEATEAVDLLDVAGAVQGVSGTRLYAHRQSAGQDHDRKTESAPYQRYTYRLPPTASVEVEELLRYRGRLFLIVDAFEEDGLLVVEADELRRDARVRVQYGAESIYDPVSDTSSAKTAIEVDGLRMARVLRYSMPNVSAPQAEPGDQTWYFVSKQIPGCVAGDVFTAEGTRWRVVSANRQSGVWMAHCRPA
ncbi:hypothetical protein [Cupriavidus metallidurans]|uniref:hypothetical protein n=1 Tax=Cupriavidus metallidurans TaxID=119219 RepID=UPI0016466699|nr:hypothetical protein [Cupriavidus metallidurans]